jgi:hypothetical protein
MTLAMKLFEEGGFSAKRQATHNIRLHLWAAHGLEPERISMI